MAVILIDFRIFRKIITKIGDIFFSQKIVARLYQSKPVISSTPSLNVDQNCRFFIQPVGRASSLSYKTMMRLFSRAGWNWRLQRGLQVDLLGGGAPLGLPDHIPAAPPQCPPRKHHDHGLRILTPRNKLTKLRDAIAISKSETINHWLTSIEIEGGNGRGGGKGRIFKCGMVHKMFYRL